MFLYLRASGHPYVVHPIHLYTPRGSDTSICPHTLCICSQRLQHGVGGCRWPLACWTPPLHAGHLPCMGVPPHMSFTPIHWLASLCICMFSGISACDMGNIPLMLGVCGTSAPLGVCMLHLVPSCSSLCLTYLPWL